MLQSNRAKVLAVVLAVIMVGCVSVAVLSQQQPPMPPYPGDQGNMPPPGQGGQMGPGQMGPGQMGPGGQQGPGGGFGGGMRMGGPMMGMGGGSASIAATAEYVYVVQGNTLYQFSAKTLKQLNKAELATTQTRNQAPVYPNQAPGQ